MLNALPKEALMDVIRNEAFYEKAVASSDLVSCVRSDENGAFEWSLPDDGVDVVELQRPLREEAPGAQGTCPREKSGCRAPSVSSLQPQRRRVQWWRRLAIC